MVLLGRMQHTKHCCYWCCCHGVCAVDDVQDGANGVGAKNIVTPTDTPALREAAIKHVCSLLGDDAETKLPVWCGDRKK